MEKHLSPPGSISYWALTPYALVMWVKWFASDALSFFADICRQGNHVVYVFFRFAIFSPSVCLASETEPCTFCFLKSLPRHQKKLTDVSPSPLFHSLAIF